VYGYVDRLGYGSDEGLWAIKTFPQFLDLVQGVFWTPENIFPSDDIFVNPFNKGCQPLAKTLGEYSVFFGRRLRGTPPNQKASPGE